MARQHPGESVGSYIMEGIIRFLVSDSPIAAALREMAIFKLVPMVNIDGVIHGNYRTSLIGCDLNRRWKNPKSVISIDTPSSYSPFLSLIPSNSDNQNKIPYQS